MMRSVMLSAALISCAAMGAEPVRVFVSLGSNLGRPEDAVLQHAEEDAVRMKELFVELGGVESKRAFVMERPTASDVREKFAEVTGRVAELEAAGNSVQLFVFATSHGKQGVLHLRGSELPVEELRELSRRTGAALRVVMVDACEAGVRTKGVHRGPAYELQIKKPDVEGDVFLSSSGAHEAAQEWQALQGSLFTHHLASGLRGDADADGDGRVSLMEAYSYAERRTVAQSVDVGQHPQFDVDVTGHGDLVLTAPARSRAKVTFAEGLVGRYVLTSLPRPTLVIEVMKSRGNSRVIAVPPGRYLVRQARGFSVALQEVDVPFGGTEAVDEKKFIRRDFGEVALKGGELEFHPHALLVSGGIFSPPVAETPLRWNVSVGYRASVGTLWAMGSVSWGAMRFSARQVTVNDQRLAGRLLAGFRIWLGPFIVMFGAFAELSLLQQSFVRVREDEIAKIYGALPVRRTPGFATGPVARFEMPLVGPLLLTVGVSGSVRALPTEGAPLWTFGAEGEVGLGVRL